MQRHRQDAELDRLQAAMAQQLECQALLQAELAQHDAQVCASKLAVKARL